MKKTEFEKVNLYSNALMAVTSIHHIYGAVIYVTPWRMHVLLVSIPVIAVSLLYGVLVRKGITKEGGALSWIWWAIVLSASVVLIGSFEGVYNHLLKNLLFYSGATHELLMQLFPPPTYEMPNDFFFELTGIMQGIVLIPLAGAFWRLTKRMYLTWQSQE